MATLPFGEGRMRLFLVLGALSASFSLDMTPVAAQRAALQITDACRGCFRRDGVVVLRGLVEQAPQPLKRQGCPCSEDIEEYAGVHSECRLAASLACTLLRADAVRDPIGDWGKGWTHAHDHYTYASSIEERDTTVVVVLPREPVTLTLKGYPREVIEPTVHSSTSYPASFALSTSEDEGMPRLVPTLPPPEPEIHLDAGDALVLRGDRTEPPGGLGGGALVYHFAACEVNDPSSLFSSPVHEAKAALQASWAQQ